MSKKLMAEFFGTFWLVFGGCGSALLAAGVADVGIGWLGVSLAFGLTVVTMAYAVGHISGGHFNPAVSLGVLIAGRMEAKDILPYWVAQVLGGLAAAAVLYLIVSGGAGFEGPGGFASNGYGEASPAGYNMWSAVVILGATSSGAPAGFGPLAIGLCLTLIHLVSIPVTNTSVNPARSTAVAVFADGPALSQLWLFWVAPLVGAAIGAVVWKLLSSDD
jgi:aquaporin Z